MDAVNFKTNFIGKDGFVWWIGQIAPEDVWLENFGKNSEDTAKSVSYTHLTLPTKRIV